MFRKMRLADQELSKDDTVAILKEKTNGTLAINGQGKYPYSVPVSYVYDDGKIYFHGAVEGEKFDLLAENPYVSFSVIDYDDVQAAKFTTYYRSVIIYGDVKRLEDPASIQKAMDATVDKYSPGLTEGGRKFLKASENTICVYELDIVHMTGKKSA